MRDFAADDRSQSETLGFTLLVGLTLIGVSAVVVLGGAALDDARHATETQLAEQSLSQLDSEISLVALGHAESRRVDLGRLDGGTTQVESDTGWLRVQHINYTGNSDTTLYNASLGSVVYQNGGTSVAYQGGGVWRSDGRGSVMVSPPEIHYRGTTLVLPAILIEGQGSSGGQPSILVRQNTPLKKIYPNSSADAHYPNGRPYANPVRNGTIQLSVHSEYYQAWADYFRTRTRGDVTVYDTNQTVTLELVAPGVTGEFDFPADGNAISLRGVTGGHSITNFTVTLAPDDLDAASFANMDWSLVAGSTNRRFDFNVKNAGGKPCTGGSPSFDVTLTYESGGQTYVWQNDSAFVENGTGAFTYTCDGSPELQINFTGTTELEYVSGPEPVEFTQHAADDDQTYTHGSTANTSYLINHYLGLFDSSIDLQIQDGQSGNKGNAAGSVDESESVGYLDYDASGQVVTFLHVTETEVRAEFT